ncbi:uncharacterized protein UTRI_03224_B [Ustilago trichophora]|uniref:BTB domain-containing protein n=1 Tax=Ustilago trichophora TaxID=86804 RepID=A0A5C3E3T4_9BASI|nr:uncharacterized protein UTRI_03224_B [Ustilago trichophora]
MVAPTLLDCWHVRDLQRFRAVLKGTPSDKSNATQVNQNGSYGAGAAAFSKSPHSYKEHTGPCPPAEVNRRDHLGRTVLHHIASSTEPWSVSYLNAILAHPSLNVNLQDGESGYTALHRALYAANLQTAIILLKRTDLDLRVKDFEGLTAFDLYNSTVAGTNPPADALSFEPTRHHHSRTLTQLFTWGSNRNYNLGLGDGDDRQLPDKITLRHNASQSTQDAFRASLPAGKKFDRIGIKDVAMSRLHSVVLTDQKVSNVWVCGLGSNGRLGRSPQTQTSFEPLKDFNETARSVAVAQDHTLIITHSGAVYSFGLNRFAQLGYTIEQGLGTVASTSGKFGGAGVTFGQPPTSTQTAELDIQITPRRILGPLKKEVVLGAACSKLHSAVFTSEGLYTWGTNTGQLGYDRSGTAVQVLPRKVTALAAGAGIQQVAASDFGTACLMEGGDVFVWHNDTHFRINFPLARFSSSISVFRPRQVQPKTLISKLSSSGNTFSALSDMGDLFTFNLEHPSEYGNTGTPGRASASSASAAKSSAAQLAPKPQLLWSVRKKFTAVRDVAIGADGSVILCTESGHCFVRPRRSDTGGKGGGGKNFKFQQIPYLQRVVKVATSESGALAAIKADPSLPDVRVKGRTVEEALRDLLPHLKVQSLSQDGEKEKGITSEVVEISDVRSEADPDSDSEDERGDQAGKRLTDAGKYVKMALLIMEAAKRWAAGRIVSGSDADQVEGGRTAQASAPEHQTASMAGRRQAFYGPHNLTPPFGCDAFLIADGHYLPVHKIILGARIPSLRKALQDPNAKESLPQGIKMTTTGASKRVSILTLSNCSLVSALFLLHYIYSDDLPPIWVASVGLMIDKELKAAKIDRVRVQDEVRAIAERLGLSALADSVKASMPRQPEPSLRENMLELFNSYVDVDASEAQETKSFNDVLLRLEDRTVPAHSVILRRSPFFAALFQPHWTAGRWDSQNVITLNLSHLRWEVARIVLMHLYTDNGETLFTGCDADRSLEQYMDFLVEVMAAANELLLDKLKLVVSSLLRKRILAHTVGAVMTEADFYKADQLKDITMNYCTKSMEALLEGGRLNELDYGMLRALTVYVRQKQDEKLHRSFAEDRLAALVEKHREFYEDLDIPPPSLHLVVNKVRAKKASAAGVKSPPLLAQDSNRRRSSSRFGVASLASPDALRPVGGSVSQRAMADDAPEMFSMDDEDLSTPRKDSSARAQGSPWAALPQVAHLSLDDSTDKGSPSRPWKSRTVEAERKQAVADSSASPALRPVDAPSDLRSIMAREQQRQQQQSAVPHLSNATTPSGSGTSTPIQKSATPGFELSPINVANTRLSQKERKRQQQEAGLAAAAAAAAAAAPAPARSGSVSSPWKLGSSPPAASSPWSLKAAATTAMALSTSHEGTPPLSSTTNGRRPSAAPLQSGTAGQGSRPSISDASPTPANSMGPTYTPMRMGSKTVPKRMGSNNNESAWAMPTVAPPLGSFGTSPTAAPAPASTARATRPEAQRGPPSNLQRSLLGADAPSVSRSSSEAPRADRATSPASPAQMTFTQIQEQQRMAIEAEQETIRQAAAARRSFLDIQEEERKAEERRKEEQKQAEEFEKWFAEESKRIQKQNSKTAKPTASGAPGGGKGKGQKKAAKQQPKDQASSSSKPNQDAAPSANGSSGSAKPKPQNSGKKGGAGKAGGKQANGAPADADGTPNKKRANGEGGNKPSPKPNDKNSGGKGKSGQNNNSKPNASASGSNRNGNSTVNADGEAKTTGSAQNNLPPKPTPAPAPAPAIAANLSAAAPTFTPRQG